MMLVYEKLLIFLKNLLHHSSGRVLYLSPCHTHLSHDFGKLI